MICGGTRFLSDLLVNGGTLLTGGLFRLRLKHNQFFCFNRQLLDRLEIVAQLLFNLCWLWFHLQWFGLFPVAPAAVQLKEAAEPKLHAEFIQSFVPVGSSRIGNMPISPFECDREPIAQQVAEPKRDLKIQFERLPNH